MIVRRAGGGELELRAFDGFRAPSRLAGGIPGIAVTSQTVGGLPAFAAAVRLAATSVAGLPIGVWRGRGERRQSVTATWQARLFDRLNVSGPNPVQSRFVFWEAIGESLGFRGNGYIWKVRDPGSSRVLELWALHPDQVTPVVTGTGELRFRVEFAPGCVDPIGIGRGRVEVGRSTILHVRGHGGGGALIAPSPIERFRATLGAALAKVRHEEQLYARGAQTGLVVEFPERVTQQQAREWRENFEGEYGGVENAYKVKVIGGGATIRPITLTPHDAQFVESQRLTVEEIARICGVPTSLIGGGTMDKPVTPEHEQDRWLRFGLMPLLDRIEAAVANDPDLFGPGSRDYPAFYVPDVRGDVRTESARLVSEVQAGILLPDEARAAKGLPPLPGGVGMIPQITPVGGAPNPAAPGIPPPDPDGE